MAFAPDQLLLTATKLAQLEAALGGAGTLTRICAEAEADVARYTAGYTLAQESLDGFIRALALFKAFSLVGPVPADIKLQYEKALEELQAIASGQRTNLPRADDPEIAGSPAGQWGSEEKIKFRA